MTRPPSAEAAATEAPGSSRGGETTRWFLRTDPRPDADVTLYCLPHAGAGASAYRAWPGLLPSWIDVAAVQLPGRERRIAEPPSVDPAAITAAITADAAGRPFALFGHSMGGLLAFDVARGLAAAGLPGPAHLAVSATAHPRTPVPSTISDLPRARLLGWLRDQGGAPDWVLDDPQLLELLLPPLRADSAWMETYRYRPGPALVCGISVFASADDPRTQACDLTEWAAETAAACAVRQYPGGHFSLVERPEPLLADLAGDLAPHRRSR